jgi:taurine dioxygenase
VQVKITPLPGALGAEIADIDLSADLDDATVAVIRQAWLDHLVIFFRDRELPPARFLAFARRFGTVIEYPFIKGLDDFPLIVSVVKLEHETVNFGGIWHSDTTYQSEPPSATLLIAREVPPSGGDTLFANQYLAYETLPRDLKHRLNGMKAISSSAKADTTRSREDRMRDLGKVDVAEEYAAEHPVIRSHPETGRKSLFINRAHTARFVGMTEQESAPLLAQLFEHQVKPEFLCRFHWRVGSLAMWDNRCTLHNPMNDYHGHRRLMHRITIAGDRPR